MNNEYQCTRLGTAQWRARDINNNHASNQRPPAGAHRCQALNFRLFIIFLKDENYAACGQVKYILWLGDAYIEAR